MMMFSKVKELQMTETLLLRDSAAGASRWALLGARSGDQSLHHSEGCWAQRWVSKSPQPTWRALCTNRKGGISNSVWLHVCSSARASLLYYVEIQPQMTWGNPAPCITSRVQNKTSETCHSRQMASH